MSLIDTMPIDMLVEGFSRLFGKRSITQRKKERGVVRYARKPKINGRLIECIDCYLWVPRRPNLIRCGPCAARHRQKYFALRYQNVQRPQHLAKKQGA